VDKDKVMDKELLSISGPREADGQSYTLSVDQDKLMDKELLSISGPWQADGQSPDTKQSYILTHCKEKFTLTFKVFHWTASQSKEICFTPHIDITVAILT
jgi:hypothetical protein